MDFAYINDFHFVARALVSTVWLEQYIGHSPTVPEMTKRQDEEGINPSNSSCSHVKGGPKNLDRMKTMSSH